MSTFPDNLIWPADNEGKPIWNYNRRASEGGPPKTASADLAAGYHASVIRIAEFRRCLAITTPRPPDEPAPK